MNEIAFAAADESRASSFTNTDTCITVWFCCEPTAVSASLTAASDALQRGHLVLGVSGVLCAGILYSWVKSQNADKQVLNDTNLKGENKQIPAASHT